MLDVFPALWQPAVRGGASSVCKWYLEDAVVVYGIICGHGTDTVGIVPALKPTSRNDSNFQQCNIKTNQNQPRFL